jgi:glyoxylase-like metal-dependent hydrolase (beta-lactamase superfamily II)
MDDLRIQTIVSEPFEENSYIVGRVDDREVVVIDPGFEPERILDEIESNDLVLVGILNTHGHPDHIAGNAALKAAFPNAPLLIGRGDAAMLTDAERNLSAAFGIPLVSPPADRLLDEGDRCDLAGLTFEVVEIPGHSPGHIVFVVRGEPIRVFGGDVLFRGSIGRTDFPGGSFEQLVHGIRRKLWSFPSNAVVYPGHGPVTTIGHERQTNPFVGGEN